MGQFVRLVHLYRREGSSNIEVSRVGVRQPHFLLPLDVVRRDDSEYSRTQEMSLLMDYWGLQAIAQRMGWKDPRAPVRAHLLEAFPMFTRRKGQHPRKVYYTSDELINLWHLAKANAHRDQLLAKFEEKLNVDQSHKRV